MPLPWFIHNILGVRSYLHSNQISHMMPFDAAISVADNWTDRLAARLSSRSRIVV